MASGFDVSALSALALTTRAVEASWLLSAAGTISVSEISNTSMLETALQKYRHFEHSKSTTHKASAGFFGIGASEETASASVHPSHRAPDTRLSRTQVCQLSVPMRMVV